MPTHTCACLFKYVFCLSLYSASSQVLLLPPPPAVTLLIYNFENFEHERQFYFQPPNSGLYFPLHSAC